MVTLKWPKERSWKRIRWEHMIEYDIDIVTKIKQDVNVAAFLPLPHQLSHDQMDFGN